MDFNVFSKLSRIVETHSFAAANDDLHTHTDDGDRDYYDQDDIMGMLGDTATSTNSNTYNNAKTAASSSSSAAAQQKNSGKATTPFEVWKSKQKQERPKATPKLNGAQWDKLVDKMHHANRTTHSKGRASRQSGERNRDNHTFFLRLSLMRVDLSPICGLNVSSRSSISKRICRRISLRTSFSSAYL
jgi:hypothetical protein